MSTCPSVPCRLVTCHCPGFKPSESDANRCENCLHNLALHKKSIHDILCEFDNCLSAQDDAEEGPAVSYCMQCMKLSCQACAELHLSKGKGRTHQMEKLKSENLNSCRLATCPCPGFQPSERDDNRCGNCPHNLALHKPIYDDLFCGFDNCMSAQDDAEEGPAVSYCMQCMKLSCQACGELHLSKGKGRTHLLENIRSRDKSNDKIISSSRPSDSKLGRGDEVSVPDKRFRICNTCDSQIDINIEYCTKCRTGDDTSMRVIVDLSNTPSPQYQSSSAGGGEAYEGRRHSDLLDQSEEGCALCRYGEVSPTEKEKGQEHLESFKPRLWGGNHISSYKKDLNARVKQRRRCYDSSFGLSSCYSCSLSSISTSIFNSSSICRAYKLSCYSTLAQAIGSVGSSGTSSWSSEWWTPAKIGIPNTKSKEARPLSYFWLINNRKEAPLRFKKEFSINQIYSVKKFMYIKRGDATMKLAKQADPNSKPTQRTVTRQVSWDGNKCTIATKRINLESTDEALNAMLSLRGNDRLTKMTSGERLKAFFYLRENNWDMTVADKIKSFQVEDKLWIDKKKTAIDGDDIEFEYSQVDVSGAVYPFKCCAPIIIGDYKGEECKALHVDRYSYSNRSPLNYLLQACFVDRFGDVLPPRNGQKRRKCTYKFERGEYLTRDADMNLPYLKTISTEVNKIHTTVSGYNPMWPQAIQDFKQFYGTNQERKAYLVEKIKNKMRNKAITVFISSPFDGCDDERNALKVKFEALKSYCSRKGVFLKLINFQWGITDHLSKENKTVLWCMEAVDQADIFIGYYGARYGTSVLSKPEAKTWLDPAIDLCGGKFSYLNDYRDRSVTEMEWQHAFLHSDHSTRPDKPISFFLFRSSNYDAEKAEKLTKTDVRELDPSSNDIRAKNERWYQVENEESRIALSRLKDEVKTKSKEFLPPPAPAGGKSLAAVFDNYADPEQGADIMFNCCNTLIKGVIDELQLEKFDDKYLNQLAFVNSRLAFYSDWDDHLRTQINKYVKGEDAGLINYPLVISGRRGSGKSSHLAKTVDFLLTATMNSGSVVNCHVIYHFCGCDKKSQALLCLMERIYKEFNLFLKDRIYIEFESLLSKELISKIDDLIIKIDPSKEKSFNKMLSSLDRIMSWLSQTIALLPSVVFVIDAIDQIEETKYDACLPSELKWLPNSFHSDNIKLIVSCLESSKASNVIKETRGFTVINIPELNSDNKRSVIKTWHETFLKDLDDKYMDGLFTSKECDNIMYLSMVLNQMLIYGTYASITSGSLLRELLEAKSIPSLMQRIILGNGKLIRKKYSLPADIDILKDVMCYVYCSRGGLTNDELSSLLIAKHPGLRDSSSSWASINFECELPSILCYRLGMLTVEHKYVLDAIERAFILQDQTFADLEELSSNFNMDLASMKEYESRLAAGKEAVLNLHIELVQMFKIKANEISSMTGDDGSSESFPRELQELEYHEREANMRPSVIVAVRCRPLRSTSIGAKPIVKFNQKAILLINPASNDMLEFDRCNLLFNESVSQEKLYSSCGKDIVKQVLSGYDSSIIAYGQTGSGKTYTMLGEKGNPGLIPRIMKELISELTSEEKSLGWQWRAVCTAVEVYKDEAYDLLDNKLSVLKSQLTKIKSDLDKYSVESVVEEMKAAGCADPEALKKKISVLVSEKDTLQPKGDGATCPYTKVREELLLLQDILERYNYLKHTHHKSVSVAGNNNCNDDLLQYNAKKARLEKELHDNDFSNISELNDYLSNTSNTRGRVYLLDLQKRYEKVISVAGKFKFKTNNSLSSPSSSDIDSNAFETFNVSYSDLGKNIKGFRGTPISDFEGFNIMMGQIYRNRRFATTKYNDRSSRSHLVITLHITRENRRLKKGPVEVKVNLVDLAGSESASKIGCERIEETIATNKSLLALKKCIKALSNKVNKSNFFPFRESLLTKILQDSLAGVKNKLILIGTLNIDDKDYDETKNTLKYVSLATNISNGRNIIAQSEALRIQRENDEAKEYLCSRFGVSDSHCALVQEYCNNHYFVVKSSWTIEKLRWNRKLEQFSNPSSSNPTAWVRKFSARCINASEPRYLKALPQEVIDCNILFTHMDKSGNSQFFLAIDCVLDKSSCILLSDVNKDSRSAEVSIRITAPVAPGLYMIRTKIDIASSFHHLTGICLQDMSCLERLSDFVAWLRVEPDLKPSENTKMSKIAEFDSIAARHPKPAIPPKRVSFIIDYSGSMVSTDDRSTTRLSAAIDMVLGIYDNEDIIADQDYLSFALFDHAYNEVVPFKPKGPTFREAIDSSRTANGGTALYDAIQIGLSKFQSSTHTKVAGGDWMIILTDGDDLHSQETAEADCIRLLIASDVHVFIIGFMLTDGSKARLSLEKIVATVARDRVQLLNASNDRALANAFAIIGEAVASRPLKSGRFPFMGHIQEYCSRPGCTSKSLFKCKCLVATYCGKECQILHWKQHKKAVAHPK